MPDNPPGDGHRFVTIDVLAEALNVTENRARQIARQEHIRTAPGIRPREYLWADVVTVSKHRTGEPK